MVLEEPSGIYGKKTPLPEAGQIPHNCGYAKRQSAERIGQSVRKKQNRPFLIRYAPCALLFAVAVWVNSVCLVCFA